MSCQHGEETFRAPIKKTTKTITTKDGVLTQTTTTTTNKDGVLTQTTTTTTNKDGVLTQTTTTTEDGVPAKTTTAITTTEDDPKEPKFSDFYQPSQQQKNYELLLVGAGAFALGFAVFRLL